MKRLYPEIEVYNEFNLPVSDVHTLNVEESEKVWFNISVFVK